MCPNPKCKCPKQVTFTLNQFHPEGPGFKGTLKKIEKTGKVQLVF